MYDQIFLAFKEYAEQYITNFSHIDHGALPMEEALTMVLGPGTEVSKHFGMGSVQELPVVFNGKSSSMARMLADMSQVHAKASTATEAELPGTDEWQILSATTMSSPHYIGQDPNPRQWLYGSAIRLRVYIEGGKC